MSSSVELLSPDRASAGFGSAQHSETIAGRDARGQTRLWRYLPLSVLTTACVIVCPAALASAIVPRGGLLLAAVSAMSAVAASIALASAAAALWKRQPGSRDLLFADLMLWGWLRRFAAERRLSQARELFDSARKAGPTVNIELLMGLSRVLEGRDAYTQRHGERVAGNAVRIARAMHLPAVEIAKIHAAATVHDVGKIFTPREILNNPRRLTHGEFAVLQRHAVEGAEMLETVGDPEISAMVRHHHERVDGHGYPDGLVGSEIPLGARIIAVADTFDAITSSRPYRPAARQKRALDILTAEGGSQLDADAVAAFLHRYSARRSVAWLSLATAAAQRIPATLQSASSSLGTSVGGLASILPALGAAGLLAVSPGLGHGTLAHSKALQPAFTGSRRAATAATVALGAPRHESRHASKVNPAPSDRHRTNRIPAGSRGTPVSRSPTAGAPKAPATSTGTSPDEPVIAGPISLPKVSTPTPTPPTTLPPIETVPTLPALPATPPVSVPSVQTPSVKVLDTGAPSVRTAAVEVP
jgi:HD domain